MYTTAVRLPAVGSDTAGSIEGHARGEGPAMKGATTTTTAKPKGTPPATTSDRLIAAMEFLNANATRGADLVQLARVAGLSPFHFHRLFKAAYGETPKQASTRLQIQHLQGLLVKGVPLEEAALQSGFANQSHMTWRFRQAVGESPGRWLRAQREQAHQKGGEAS